MDKPKRIFLSAVQAAKLVGISNKEMLDHLKAGEIEAMKTDGGHWRIPVACLEKWAVEAAHNETFERREAYEEARFANIENPRTSETA